MSEPLQKIPLDPKLGSVTVETLLLTRLNAAITRINELEARYEGHTHHLDALSTERTTPPSKEPTDVHPN